MFHLLECVTDHHFTYFFRSIKTFVFCDNDGNMKNEHIRGTAHVILGGTGNVAVEGCWGCNCQRGGPEEDQRLYRCGYRGHGDKWFEEREWRGHGQMQEDDLMWWHLKGKRRRRRDWNDETGESMKTGCWKGGKVLKHLTSKSSETEQFNYWCL